MKAIVDFDATRQHIEYAIRVFSEGEQQARIQLAADEYNWAVAQAKRAWFNKNVDYWLSYARGEVEGEAGIGSYCTASSLRRDTNLDWFIGRHEKALALLARFNCAVKDCEASAIYLSDDDLTLLSVSLDSALENA